MYSTFSILFSPFGKPKRLAMRMPTGIKLPNTPEGFKGSLGGFKRSAQAAGPGTECSVADEYLSKHELKICSKSSQNLSKIIQKLIKNCVFGGFGGHVAPRSRFFRFFIDFYLSLDRSLGWWKWPIPIACYTIAHFGLFVVLKNKLNIKPS